MEILSALNHMSIKRLKATWDKIDPKDCTYYQTLRDIMFEGVNMTTYRQIISSLLTNNMHLHAFVPYLGKYELSH